MILRKQKEKYEIIEKKFEELCDICDEEMADIFIQDYNDGLDLEDFTLKDFLYPGNPQTKFYNELHDFMKKSGRCYKFEFINSGFECDGGLFFSTYALSWYDGEIHMLYHTFETAY